MGSKNVIIAAKVAENASNLIFRELEKKGIASSFPEDEVYDFVFNLVRDIVATSEKPTGSELLNG